MQQLNFENLRDAILREAEGGPIEIITEIPQNYEESFEDAVDRFLKEHPGSSYSEPWEESEAFITTPKQPCPPWVTMYIGVFELNRQYGGPEEGGWWYDVGYVTESESIRVRFDENRKPYLQEGELEFLKELSEKLSSEYSFGTSHRGSMRPRGSDFSWDISWNVPKDFPENRPYYS